MEEMLKADDVVCLDMEVRKRAAAADVNERAMKRVTHEEERLRHVVLCLRGFDVSGELSRSPC